MLPLHKIIFFETLSAIPEDRVPESEAMDNADQVESYVKAYESGGPTSALQLHHLKELSMMVRSGDTIVDLACGPGPLLLELAELCPDCRFIGVDLSALMLASLNEKAKSRNLKNIRTIQGDIRTLKKEDVDGGADLIISTSALHHLPEVNDLERVFKMVTTILNRDGGIYFFDFGLLKSDKTRKFFVDELKKTAPPLTVKDYEDSLKACFPLSIVFNLASAYLPRPLWIIRSSFVDFFYFLQTPPRSKKNLAIETKIVEIWSSLNFLVKSEHLMLRLMRRRNLLVFSKRQLPSN